MPRRRASADSPDGFGIAVVREDGKWRCSAMRAASLNSLSAAETELREMRSAGAVFGLLDVDDEFFVICGLRLPARGCCCRMPPRRWTTTSPPRCWRSWTTTSTRRISKAEPFEEGDLGLLADIGLPEAVLGVILDESDLYADEQLGRIAREMGFADELSAVLDRLDR